MFQGAHLLVQCEDLVQQLALFLLQHLQNVSGARLAAGVRHRAVDRSGIRLIDQ